MKAQNKFLKSVGLTVAIFALSLTACTKAKETKSMVDPNSYVAKSDFEGKTFSLVRGIEEADSNNVVGATPGMSEDFGFVKVRITETEIQFLEVFNLANKAETQSVLASFAIKDHFDIQREENDFRETTHKIVENKEKPWNQRRFMRVDWSAPTNQKSKLASSTDAPTVESENIVLLEDPKVENGHISWLTEFSAQGGTRWWGEVLKNSRVVARTHLMPVKTTDFERVNFRTKDFDRFGYFTTRQQFENPEKGPIDSELEDHTFANLHNVCEPGRTDATGKPLSCSTGKIVWHLSKNFPEKYRAGSRQAVSEWNDTFKAALGRADDVVVLDESKEVDVVDPRYNTIALYSAKSSGGLLGVAQEVVNPMTGETIASRATVYEDGIRGTLGMVDAVVTMILQDDEVRQAFLATDAETRERVETIFKKSNLKQNQDPVALRLSLGLSSEKSPATSSPRKSAVRTNALEVRHSVKEIAARLQEAPDKSMARKARLMKAAPDLFATNEQAKFVSDDPAKQGTLGNFDDAFGFLGAKQATANRLTALGVPSLGGLESLNDIASSRREERARMMNQAAKGVHGAELVEEAALRYIKKVLAQHPEAADFRAQVEALKAEVDRKTFYTTLLHEMGHTFGLRHNFQGSADAKHYHPEFFRLSKQIEAEKDLPADQQTVTTADLEPYMFSSIMDYGGDFYSQIGGLGPYDKAAIRFGYNRSIDKAKDPVINANFQFCTDHQVDESILCRRFDKGRNVSEITFNLIESYQTNWVLSHFRRDRATFERSARAYPMRAMSRYFIPVRQVMDEFLFALVDAKTVAAKENECGMAYWKDSVDKGEIVNVCNAVEAEQAGVDPTNLETFEAGLFDDKGLRKSPIAYQPYGLADLLFANIIAKQFYAEVLGSAEPGKYVALPVSKGVANLEKLPEGKDLDESLATFATEHDFESTPELIGQLKALVGEVKVGRYGKPFNSEWDETSSDPKQKNIGAFWDKYVAMVALGLKDFGVSKYYRKSMTGNAYAFPHTTGFAQKVMKSMITQKDRLMSIPFKTPAGTFDASVEPTLNLDIRAIATITALTDFVSDGDESIADKLRVCSVNEQGCKTSFGVKTAEFTTASGQDVYRSVQTTSGDSIAFELISEAAKIDAQRKDWVQKQQKASDTTVENLMKLNELEPARASLEKTLAALQIEELGKILPTFLSADPKTPSMWNLVNMLTQQIDQIPLFNTINLVQQSSGVLNATAQILGQSIEALDPSGQCPTPAAPKTTEVEESTKKLPAVIGLDAMLKGRTRKFKTMGRFAHLDATVAPAVTEKKNEAPAADCAAIVAKRAVLVAAGSEFQEFAVAIGRILNTTIDAKAAPLRAKRATDELKRAEASVKFIRKVSKATGLE